MSVEHSSDDSDNIGESHKDRTDRNRQQEKKTEEKRRGISSIRGSVQGACLNAI